MDSSHPQARALAALLIAIGGLAAAPAAQADDKPSTLTPIDLQAADLVEVDQGTSEFSGNCDPLGNSSYSFTTTGLAADPPNEQGGTYTESGTFALGPQLTLPGGGVLSAPITFESSFEIVFPDRTITGTKTLSAVPLEPFNLGFCGDVLDPPGTDFPANAFSLQLRADYSALIETDKGTYLDHGTSVVDYGDIGVRDPLFTSFRFFETFSSILKKPIKIKDE